MYSHEKPDQQLTLEKYLLPDSTEDARTGPTYIAQRPPNPSQQGEEEFWAWSTFEVSVFCAEKLFLPSADLKTRDTRRTGKAKFRSLFQISVRNTMYLTSQE